MVNPIKPYELHNAQAPAYWQVDILWILLASSEQTGGSYTLLEQLCPQGSGPGPHYHEQDEAFYILDGEITYAANGETIEGAAGSFIFIPRGTVHSFVVKSKTARILNSYTPGGFERIIMALGEPAQERVLPPKGRPMRGDREKAVKVMQEIGMHVVEEPDPLRD
ncbi:MAG: quercetin 2,3-dioxygenase [Chthoniobacterales bacterium]